MGDRKADGAWALIPVETEEIRALARVLERMVAALGGPESAEKPVRWTPKPGDRVRLVGGCWLEGATARVVRADGDPGDNIEVRFDNGGNTGFVSPANIRPLPPAPQPSRTVRVPAIGQRVRVTMRPPTTKDWGFDGTVESIVVNKGHCTVVVRDNGRWHVAPEDVAPIGPDPRWITICLPEEAE